MTNIIPIAPAEEWPSTIREVRAATNQQLWRWINQKEGRVPFIIGLAMMDECRKRKIGMKI